MDLLKGLAGKIVGAIGLLVVAAGAISWWRMDPTTRQALVHNTGSIIGWLLAVALLPWATFFLIAWVNRMRSNLAGGLLVTAYTAAELGLLLWLFRGIAFGSTAWTFVVVGVLLAGVYNVLICDWLAERFD